MKPPPKDWPRISSSLFYEDAPAAIDWLCKAFDFKVRLRVDGEDGSIVHSELDYGEGLIMVSSVKPGRNSAAPSQVKGLNTQSLCVQVENVEAHLAQARAAGAVITDELAVHDYGEEYWADRAYGATDPGGHRWWFSQRIRG